jgi:hypothetical protein
VKKGKNRMKISKLTMIEELSEQNEKVREAFYSHLSVDRRGERSFLDKRVEVK